MSDYLLSFSYLDNYDELPEHLRENTVNPEMLGDSEPEFQITDRKELIVTVTKPKYPKDILGLNIPTAVHMWVDGIPHQIFSLKVPLYRIDDTGNVLGKLTDVMQLMNHKVTFEVLGVLHSKIVGVSLPDTELAESLKKCFN